MRIRRQVFLHQNGVRKIVRAKQWLVFTRKMTSSGGLSLSSSAEHLRKLMSKFDSARFESFPKNYRQFICHDATELVINRTVFFSYSSSGGISTLAFFA